MNKKLKLDPSRLLGFKMLNKVCGSPAVIGAKIGKQDAEQGQPQPAAIGAKIGKGPATDRMKIGARIGKGAKLGKSEI